MLATKCPPGTILPACGAAVWFGNLAFFAQVLQL